MTPRHRETAYHPQPVRFYKVVALTFLCFTIVLLGVIIFMSTKRATIVIETKAAPVDVTGTIQVKSGEDTAVLPGSTVTSTVVSITHTFSPEGGREEDAVAEGQVTIHNETTA